MAHYEPGSYKAKVTGQRFGVTPNGSPYFAIQIEPTDAVGANDLPEAIYPRDVTLYVTEKAAPFTIEKLRELGFRGTKFTQLDPESEKHHSFVGQSLDVICKIGEKGYDEWDLARTAGSADQRQNDPKIASRLDNLFGKALVASVPPASEPKQEAKEENFAKDCPF